LLVEYRAFGWEGKGDNKPKFDSLFGIVAPNGYIVIVSVCVSCWFSVLIIVCSHPCIGTSFKQIFTMIVAFSWYVGFAGLVATHVLLPLVFFVPLGLGLDLWDDWQEKSNNAAMSEDKRKKLNEEWKKKQKRKNAKEEQADEEIEIYGIAGKGEVRGKTASTVKAGARANWKLATGLVSALGVLGRKGDEAAAAGNNNYEAGGAVIMV